MSVFALAVMSISFYLLIVFLLYSFAIKSTKVIITIGKRKIIHNRYNVFFIFASVSLCMLYDLYITKTSINMGGDRTNYLYEFNNDRGILTHGLQKFMDWFRLFSDDFTTFILLICCICVGLTFVAYRINRNSTPIVIFLIFSSQYLFSIFVNFKQCFANVFAAIFFAVLFSQKGKKKDLFCIGLIILACLFHEAAIILAPIYLICRGRRVKDLKVWFILFLIAIIFLDKIAIFSANILTPFVPDIASKINLYFVNISLAGSRIILLLKGVPYYIILWIAVKRRQQLIEKIDYYDGYILVALVMAFLQIGALWSYWLPRAQYFLYLPVFTLFGQIMAKSDATKTNTVIKLLVCGSVLFFSLRDLIIMYIRYGGF